MPSEVSNPGHLAPLSQFYGLHPSRPGVILPNIVVLVQVYSSAPTGRLCKVPCPATQARRPQNRLRLVAQVAPYRIGRPLIVHRPDRVSGTPPRLRAIREVPSIAAVC